MVVLGMCASWIFSIKAVPMMRSKMWFLQPPKLTEMPFLFAWKNVLLPLKPSFDAVQSA